MIFIITLTVEVPNDLPTAEEAIKSDVVKNLSEELFNVLGIDIEQQVEGQQ
jgi:hypothetical protein